MNYAAIKTYDIANGPGVRTVLFVSGCTRHCKDCFQPQTWDFDYGEPFTQEVAGQVLQTLAPPQIAGLTLLGGEPFEPRNRPSVRDFLRQVRAAYPQKSIWAFTGFLYDELAGDPVAREIFSMLDVLVDGPFVAAQKNLTLRFRGSENQRLIDMKQTLQAGHVVIWDDGARRGGK